MVERITFIYPNDIDNASIESAIESAIKALSAGEECIVDSRAEAYTFSEGRWHPVNESAKPETAAKLDAREPT